MTVKFATGPCAGTGWKARRDTVISFRLAPKQTWTKDEILSGRTSLPIIVDHTFTEFLIDEDNGFIYRFHEDNCLTRVEFVASPNDANLRCRGFPPFSAASVAYESVETIEITRKLDEALARFTTGPLDWFANQKQIDGTAIVYCRQNRPQECRTVARRFEQHKQMILGSSGADFRIVIGGYRKKAEVETFLSLKSWPKAVPTPAFASPFF